MWVSLCLPVCAADLVLTGGRVWTGNPREPWAEAVAVEGNRVVAVGTAEAMKPHINAKTVVKQIAGRLVVPGFNDAHIHFLSGSRRLTQVDLTGVCTVESIQKYVRDYAAKHPGTGWIQGGGWEYTCFPGGRLPTRQDLDAAVANRPVFLSAYDGHTGWANTKALELAKVTRDTKFTGFGEIVVDAQGAPTGCLKEGAQSLVRRLLPRATRADNLAAAESGMKLAASLGITSIQNAHGDRDELELWESLERQGKLTLRVRLAMSVGQMNTTPKDLEEYALISKRLATANSKVRVGAVKMMLDGVVESYTAAMLDVYANNAKTSGKLAWDAAAYTAMVERADRAGLQIFTHAIGDAAVRLALDAYEKALAANGPHDARFRIEHIETISPRDVPRFAQLGVVASMEPIHCDPDTVEVWSKAVGEERLKLAFAWRSLEKAGARLVFSSDWPASISVDPIRGIHNAVNRQTVDLRPPGGWIPEQRVSLETALRGYTTEGAYAEFAEKWKGSIEPGKLADLAVLSQDAFQMPAGGLAKLKVEMTVFDGKIVFTR
jgi:predicted amidohydrolase YtcJ